MKKRAFLKTSGLLLAGNSFLPMVSCSGGKHQVSRENWAGNLVYSASGLERPGGVSEVRKVLSKQNHLRVLGTRHSFNTIADTPHRQISLDAMDDLIEISAADRTVSVNGSTQYGVLASTLHEAGFALHNLASLPHISVAGACATGTHGSGDKNGNLPSVVVGMDLITANGDVVQVSEERDGDRFHGMVVHLGALGVVHRVTLKIEPTFDVCQFVYEDLPLHSLSDHFEEIFSSGYSVSLFTDWQGHRINQLWLKMRIHGMQIPRVAEDFYGATLAQNHLHPIREISPVNCTEQMGLPGPWHLRLPHFKMEFTPSSGAELQSEYFVPRERAVEAIHALYEMGAEIYPHLLISEVRSIAADQLWMSPSYGRDSIALHFTWKPDWASVQKLLPKIESRLKPFGVRPHWGKLFTLQASDLEAQYERIGDFRDLIREYDPKGKFKNDFIANHLSI
ncbi:MAG: FAD-binding protein [Lunatimonas sp.]|uniref:D-arabinono-1,4-lactone oxidase n=1 Tax=Lunatimonas sp. TaxID=2060141 RepID=UPI00263ADC8E|nr:D-arabinono-1,4-lactone oxidase [Lunatimonas sp.]MCC5939535.1 FAD-binding protein [Lunatimonas sp.]